MNAYLGALFLRREAQERLLRVPQFGALQRPLFPCNFITQIRPGALGQILRHPSFVTSQQKRTNPVMQSAATGARWSHASRV